MLMTSDNSDFARVPVDPGQTSLEEGREFRLVRKMVTTAGKTYWKFTSTVDFILSKQSIAASIGDIEFRVYRASDVTDGGGWSATVPTFAKNISSEYREYNGARYASNVTIESGGTVTVNNAANYADYDRAKTSNATAQQASVGGAASDDRRYLAAGTYYFEFETLSAAEWRIELGWEERP